MMICVVQSFDEINELLQHREGFQRSRPRLVEDEKTMKVRMREGSARLR